MRAVLAAALICLLAGCAAPTAVPTPVPTLTAAAPPIPSPTPAPTRTPTAAPSAAPSLTPGITLTPPPGWTAFPNRFIWMAYPADWQVISRIDDPRCLPQEIDCIFRAEAPADPETFVTLARFDFFLIASSIDLVEQEESTWQGERELYGQAGLGTEIETLSYDDQVSIGGYPAVRRVYRMPYINQSGTLNGQMVMLRYMVVNPEEKALYHLYLLTRDTANLPQYEQMLAEMAATIDFRQKKSRL